MVFPASALGLRARTPALAGVERLGFAHVGDGSLLAVVRFLVLVLGQLPLDADLLGVLLPLVQGPAALWLLYGQRAKVETQTHRLVAPVVLVAFPLYLVPESRLAVDPSLLFAPLLPGSVHQMLQQVVAWPFGPYLEPLGLESSVARQLAQLLVSLRVGLGVVEVYRS